MNPRVLVVTPNYYGKDYSLEEYLEAVNGLDYDNYDSLMIDNSPDSESWFYDKLVRLGVNVRKVPRGSNSREAISNAMNFAREYFIKNNYDYMLVLESDLYPQSDTITRLLHYQKPVIGSFYLLGFESDEQKITLLEEQLTRGVISKEVFLESAKGLQPRRACAFIDHKKRDGLQGTRILTPKETVSLYNTGLQRLHGCGLGCTLIRGDIIRRFPFWTDNRFDGKHHDVYFFMDLHNAGVPVFIDTSVNVPHRPSRWERVNDR